MYNFYMRRLIILTLLFTWYQKGLAMEQPEVFHNPHRLFYTNPAAGQIKLRVKRDGITDAYVVIGLDSAAMEIEYQDENFDYFVAHLPAFDSTQTYYFVLKDTLDSLLFPLTDEFRARVPFFHTPQWAVGKTYYSIFTDGFYNGNMSNDPKEMSPGDSIPRQWLSYGGDLAGIRKRLPYIDSLGPDIIILQPIFASSSNHKLNPRDYSLLDPTLGDTTDLKELIDEVHKLQKRIILSIVVTHTGTDFSAFENIMTDGQASQYTDWYHIQSLPLKTSPPSYECWQDDYRFPKLNLASPQVQDYLLGYLEYWQHFGFDGIYLGTDEQIDPHFVKSVRKHLKTKYPDLLLLGSDTGLLEGDEFDGILNTHLSDVMLDYFVNNTITTSDFDREIKKILFFNPPQANSVNLLSLSDYKKRLCRGTSQDILTNVYAFLFTCIGSPVILYGDEIGISDSTPRHPGQFRWDEQEQNRELLNVIKQLIGIRKTHPQIAGSAFFTLYVNDITKVYAYDRGGLIVVLNSGNKRSFVELPAWDGNYLDLMSGDILTAFSQRLKFSIDAKSYRLLRREI